MQADPFTCPFPPGSLYADELAALDPENIISGPRTRQFRVSCLTTSLAGSVEKYTEKVVCNNRSGGKKIDFRKASEELGGEDDDEVSLDKLTAEQSLVVTHSFTHIARSCADDVPWVVRQNKKQDDDEDANVTANTTVPKTDDDSDEEDDEEEAAGGEDAE